MSMKKTTAEHAAKVRSIGHAELLGIYSGQFTKTLYRCLHHGQEHLALPKDLIRGRKLPCCSTRRELRKTTKQHASEVAAIGVVELAGEYKGARTKTKYRCLKHDYEDEALPTNILKGRGLSCCKQQGCQDAADRKKGKAAAKYDEELAEVGNLQRIEPYVDSKTPIKHRCLIHGQTGPAAPGDARAGKGIKCCWEAGYVASTEERRLTPQQFRQKLTEQNPNIEWVSGEYITNGAPTITCRCRKHNHTQEGVWPMQVLAGSGLYCCLQESRHYIGKRSLNGASVDNVWRALIDKLERSGNAWLYLFESPVRDFNKFGISSEPERRSTNGRYGKRLIEHRFFADRRDAVLIEQAYKYGNECEIPNELIDWVGNTELTTHTPEEFIEVIEELENSLVELGRWNFAEEYCNPVEIDRAKKEVQQ